MPNNNLQHRTGQLQRSLISQDNQGRRHSSGVTATDRIRAAREGRRNEILGRRHRRALPEPTPRDEQAEAALGPIEFSRDFNSPWQ